MSDTSLPPIRAILNASLVIAVATACASMALYQMREGEVPLVATLIGLCLGLTLVVTHYWGLFRRQPTFLLVAAIVTIPTFLYVGRSLPAVIESLVDLPESISWIILPVSSFLGAIGLSLPCVWETARWQMALKKAHDHGHKSSGFQAISLKEMLGAIAIIGLIFAPTSFAIQSDQFLYLEDIPTTAAPVSLPPEGTGLKFYRQSDGQIDAVFQVKQEDLDKWLDEMKKVPGNLGFLPRPFHPGYRTRVLVGYNNGKVDFDWQDFDDIVFTYWEDDYWRHEISYSSSKETALYERFPAYFRHPSKR